MDVGMPMKMTLIEERQEEGDVASFLFQPPAGFTWRPGQYLHWSVPHADADDRGVERYFTIASAPHEEHVMLTTRFAAENGSTFKRALRQLAPGDAVEVDGEAGGKFTLDGLEGTHVFVAGGIGITPFRAILVDLDRRGTGPPITLLYANRSAAAPFRSELDAIAARNDWLDIDYVIEPRLVDEAALRAAADGGGPTYWVSGPKPMVDAIRGVLEGMGVEAERIRQDAFPGYD